MQLEDFINKNREKALSLNIEGYPEINNVLQKQKLRPSKEFIKKAIEELESNLINCLVRNNHLSDKSKTPIYLLDIRLLLEYRQLQKEGLRFYVLAHFPRWLGKSPLYFENIRPELLGFIEALETHFADVKINSFTMDWVLNMTPLGIRKKLKKIQEAKDEMEFIIWENKVLQIIREASDDEILFYALRMYLDLTEHPLAETPKPQQNENPEPIELPKGKRGRKPTKINEAKYYLNKIQSPENKDKFLNFLKLEYKDAKPKEFNQLMKVLYDDGFLKPADSKEYKEAFEKALGSKPQSQSNFNKQFGANPDKRIYSLIQQAIDNKIKEDALV